jgi:hypothetical protein
MPYTIKSEPPTLPEAQRRSRWVELFDECRSHPGEWRRVVEPMAKATAAQVASDIRNAHRRDVTKTRVRGLDANDEWETVWGVDPSGRSTEYFIWLKYVGRRTTRK